MGSHNWSIQSAKNTFSIIKKLDFGYIQRWKTHYYAIANVFHVLLHKCRIELQLYTQQSLSLLWLEDAAIIDITALRLLKHKDKPQQLDPVDFQEIAV